MNELTISTKIQRLEDQQSVHGTIEGTPNEPNGGDTAVRAFTNPWIQQYLFEECKVSFDTLVSLSTVAKPIRLAFDKHGLCQLHMTKRFLFNESIACAEEAQKQHNNPDALRDLAIALVKHDIDSMPRAARIARRITVQTPYANYREHAFGVLAEECAKMGSKGFSHSLQLLGEIREKKEGYVAAVIYYRAGERTPLAFTEAAGLYRQVVPGRFDKSEYATAFFFLHFMRNVLLGSTVLASATHVSQLDVQGWDWERERLLDVIASEEADKGNLETAHGIAELLEIMNFQGHALSNCVKCRAEKDDDQAIEEAKELAETADMGPFRSHAMKYIAVAESKKGVFYTADQLSQIQHTVKRTEAVRDIALVKGPAEGEAYFEDIYTHGGGIYFELGNTLIFDELMHVFSQAIGQTADSNAFLNAQQLIGRIKRPNARDRALRDLAIARAKQGSSENTLASIETIHKIKDPAEQSRAFAALSFKLVKIVAVPQTDQSQGCLKQILNIIHPPQPGQST